MSLGFNELSVTAMIMLHVLHDHDDVITLKYIPRYWPFVRESLSHMTSNAHLWCFLCYKPELPVEQIFSLPVLGDAHMASIYCMESRILDVSFKWCQHGGCWWHGAYLVLTLNVRGPSYLGLTRSISWMLMPWLLTSPGHQQPWYWLCRICRS